MIRRLFLVNLIACLVLQLLPGPAPARAADPFPMPDADGDGLSNEQESAGWVNLAGGPFFTFPNDLDSDNDGLFDGDEKLFDTDPTDPRSPGIFARYQPGFYTLQYFSPDNPQYLPVVQSGGQSLMTQGLVVRRGATFHLGGPESALLSLEGSGMTPLDPQRDPALGGWAISIPLSGTVGVYTATLSEAGWSASLPVYVIFELPGDLSDQQVDYFLYDDDPQNSKDEVAVWWRVRDWSYYGDNSETPTPCPETDPDAPCSLWQYHYSQGYAQAFWTEQFKRQVFVEQAIPAVQGIADPSQAAYALGQRADREFRVNYNAIKTSWTTAMNRWDDGTGITMSGGACESNAGVFTTLLRSAGIPARPFILDYNKTAGHGETGQINTPYEYDHSVMIWLDHTWKAMRSFNSGESQYYPWVSGTTEIRPLAEWPAYTNKYIDIRSDALLSLKEGWTFQDGSGGGGTVNTLYDPDTGVPNSEFVPANREYEWNSKKPLRVIQSPLVEFLNCQLWQGDAWAPSEWSDPPVSSPEGRGAVQTYVLPAGLPDPAAPLENWPYNPRPTACSAATSEAECSAFLADWSAQCPAIPGAQPLASTQGDLQAGALVYRTFVPALLKAFTPRRPAFRLGPIRSDAGIDLEGDGRYERLELQLSLDSPLDGAYKLGGWLKAGSQVLRAETRPLALHTGSQVVPLTFDGRLLGDSRADGPYQVLALWLMPRSQAEQALVLPEETLAYQEYTYRTRPYQAADFAVRAASFAGSFSPSGLDRDGDGRFEALAVDIPLRVAVPGVFQVQGELVDGQGRWVGRLGWSGKQGAARLEFEIARTRPPYVLQQLSLADARGQILDLRYAPVLTIPDLPGGVDQGPVFIAPPASPAAHGVTPEGAISLEEADADLDGLLDLLRFHVGVSVTEQGGGYRMEGLLVDEQGAPAAWAESGVQQLTPGSGEMLLEFDGRMLYDRLPLAPGTRRFQLVALKIFHDTLSPATLDSQLEQAILTPAYTRSQFEPSSPASILFVDDLENGTSAWTADLPLWSLDGEAGRSPRHAWSAHAALPLSGTLALSSTLDLSLYAAPVLQLNTAYSMTSPQDAGSLEISRGGGEWTPLAAFSAGTPHWTTRRFDLGDYGEQPEVRLRFRGQAQDGLHWLIDDVALHAWPAVTSASFSPASQPITAGVVMTFTAGYTSITTTLPVTYTWNFGGGPQISSTPTITHRFVAEGTFPVTLTVANPYDQAVYTQALSVQPSAIYYTLAVEHIPPAGGTVAITPDEPRYVPGTPVTLQAQPAPGYAFSHWEGACSGSGECQVEMDGDRTVTGVFVQVEYVLAVTTSGLGSVRRSPDQPTYHYGDGVSLEAVPEAGWQLAAWGGALSGSANPALLTILGDTGVSAAFERDPASLPQPGPDSYQVSEGGRLAVPAAQGVLGNDIDPGGDVLSATLALPPAHGALELDSRGAFTYTHDASETLFDTFVYTATDGPGGYVTQTVQISILPVNDAPQLSPPADQASAEGEAVLLQAPASDAEGTALTFSAAGLPPGLSIGPGGWISGSLGFDSAGVYTVSLSASDGELSSAADFHWMVHNTNRPPQVEAVADQASAEGETVLLPVTASDLDGAALHYAAAGLPPGLGIEPGGWISGSLGFDSAGVYRVSLAISDGELSTGRAFTWTVYNTNRPPLALSDIYTTTLDTRLEVPAGRGVLANDQDPDGSPLAAVLASLPASGSLALEADGSFSYLPAPGVPGVVTFTYQASDGELSSEAVQVTIRVLPGIPITGEKKIYLPVMPWGKR